MFMYREAARENPLARIFHALSFSLFLGCLFDHDLPVRMLLLILSLTIFAFAWTLTMWTIDYYEEAHEDLVSGKLVQRASVRRMWRLRCRSYPCPQAGLRMAVEEWEREHGA